MESLLSTLPYPMLMAEKMRSLGMPRQHEGRPGDGHRACCGRLARHQLSDGAALARRLRDARAAGVRRASDRGHAGRPRARRVLREGPAVAVGANSRRDRRTQPGTAHSGHSRQRRRDRVGMSAVPRSRVLRRGRRRRLVVPSTGRPIPAVEDAGPAGSGRTPSRPTRRNRCDRTAQGRRRSSACRSTM